MTTMISYRKLTPKAYTPTYGTENSAGLDLYIYEPTELLPKKVTLAHTGIVIAPPEVSLLEYFSMLNSSTHIHRYYFHLYLRSSTPIRYPGVVLANGTGIIDPDYCGPEDEIMIPLLNTSDNTYLIPEGSRIAQLVLMAGMPQLLLQEIKDEDPVFLPSRGSRGGLGSTGR